MFPHALAHCFDLCGKEVNGRTPCHMYWAKNIGQGHSVLEESTKLYQELEARVKHQASVGGKQKVSKGHTPQHDTEVTPTAKAGGDQDDRTNAMVERPRKSKMSRKESYQMARRELQNVDPGAKEEVMVNLGLRYMKVADGNGLTFVEELENHPDVMLAPDNVLPTVVELEKVQRTGKAVAALRGHEKHWPGSKPSGTPTSFKPPGQRCSASLRRGAGTLPCLNLC